ncbi:MAG: TIGR01906 family membrane protein [Erysipelotrichaceae bacterium]|nr:TIGR01906 family membrane protein [Erysipelotrichaceae bacterium]MCI9523964.1 TIGR01906 family membrane protein [Erysipelotrichaceae bacterium]
MKQRWLRACAYVASAGLILVILISCIDFQCFRRGFYEREFETLRIGEDNHVSDADLMKATNALLDYIQGKRDDIQVEIELYELPFDAFNERERAHMVDVRGLYQFAIVLRRIAILLALCCGGLVIYVKKKECFTLFAAAYLRSSICFVFIVAMLALWAAIDFTSLWEMFHRLFFTNDLWLLNPRTDFMIRMFPEPLFFHMVMRIAVSFLAVFLSLGVGSIWYLKKQHLLVQTIYDMNSLKGEEKKGTIE